MILYLPLFFQLYDYRVEFSQWWTKEMKTVKLPAQGTVFDYYLDPQTRKFLPWNDIVPLFEMETCTPLQVRTYATMNIEEWDPSCNFRDFSKQFDK